ncbi:MAG: L-threonylcarbamoyladenylate synthase [Pseudomonadota bacterium]
MEILSSDQVSRAAKMLQTGELIAFPTETVYGLGASAYDGTAVAKIYAAKGRPSFNPLIVHIPTLSAARDLGSFSDRMARIAEAFWPGPLSLVVPLRSQQISSLVTAGLNTIALRVPAQPLAQALLREVDIPLAAPSANISGRLSPTRAEHVVDGLDGRIDAVLDGGPCRVGLESTIVTEHDGNILCLRVGGLPIHEIERVLGTEITVADSDTSNTPTSPGQLLSHYAPQTELRLNAQEPDEDELFLGFGEVDHGPHTLSGSGNLIEAASRLFDALHELDAMAEDTGIARIAVAPIPDHGLGLAINDRLRRAARPV